MKSVAEILKEARLEKNLSFEQIEKATKIRVKFLMAMERGEYEKLPGSIFAQGFVKNYAEFLGLNKTQISALFRREYYTVKPSTILVKRQKIPIFRFGRQARSIFVLSFVFLLAAVFIIKSYLDYSGNPKLDVIYPENNVVIQTREIEVTGWTDMENKLYLNGQLISLQKNGEFKEKITLDNGLNTITVMVTNKYNKQTEIKRTVRLEL